MMTHEKVITEIKSLSDSIRQKSRALKQGISERERFITNTLKPIIDPLHEISKNLSTDVEENNPTPTNNFETTMDGYDDDEDDNKSEEQEGEEELEDEELEEQVNKTDETTLNATQVDNTPSNLSVLAEEIDTKGLLTRKYFMKFLLATPSVSRKYHVYGARLEKEGIMVGDSGLAVDDKDNLLIKGKKFKGTPGLFELIFERIPGKFTSRDLNTFKLICKLTNAHRSKYSHSSPLHRNKSVKYKNVIAKLFPPKIRKLTGRGLSMKSAYDTNIIYYNNINKLVDRMRLLYEAKNAGHSGVNNEIVALTEELRGKGYIE
jgi:hypothetical protein